MTMVYLSQEKLAALLARMEIDPERSRAVVVCATTETAKATVIAQHEAGEELAMMIRMLTSALKRHWPHAPQPGDLPSRAIDLLRRHDLLGSPLRSADEDRGPQQAA